MVAVKHAVEVHSHASQPPGNTGVEVGFAREFQSGDDLAPLLAYRENFGFVPNLLRAQSSLPRLIEAHVALETIALVREKALPRKLKEEILLVLIAAQRDSYSATFRSMVLRSLGVPESRIRQLIVDFRSAGFSPSEIALVDFGLKLCQFGPWVCQEDIEELRAHGFDDDSILEASLVAGLTSYICATSSGLKPQPDGEIMVLPAVPIGPSEAALRRIPSHSTHGSSKKESYVHAVYQSPETFKAFLLLKDSHGFIPNFFRAQTAWPDVAEAEAVTITTVLGPEDVLSRVQKECILLAVSAANLNSYCVAAHCNLLRGMGLSPEEGDQVAVDHHQANLTDADKALVDFTLKINSRPNEVGSEDTDHLRKLGFTQKQILEAVAVTAVNNFANTHQMGLGIMPDFEPPVLFEQKKVHLFEVETRHTEWRSTVSEVRVTIDDPDAGLVADSQGGRLEAFEELVRRHSQSVYRTLMAILGNPEEAKDAMQDALLSAFKHIGGFQGRSKFSTWLVSIARNTALQRLRERKNVESLDEGGCDGDEDFRPRQIRAWQDNPEQTHSKEEIRQLVERGIMGLPAKYRVVIMLRDIEQRSTDDVAEQLGLSVPALKARLLRGRLMLRESLAPHFAPGGGRAAV